MSGSLWDAGDVATYLKIKSQGAIYRMVREGEIPHVRLGRRVRFRQEDIEKWISERARISCKST